MTSAEFAFEFGKYAGRAARAEQWGVLDMIDSAFRTWRQACAKVGESKLLRDEFQRGKDTEKEEKQ